MSKKKEKKLMIVSDPFLSTLSKSQKNAKNGIGPTNKAIQNPLDDILGDNVLVETTKREKSKWEKLRMPHGSSFLCNMPVETWKSHHLFKYFCNTFSAKYPEIEITTTMQSGSNFIKILKQDFEKELDTGKVSITLIKEYIDWFFARELDVIVASRGKFSIQYFNNKKMFRKFNSEYKTYKEEAPVEVIKIIDTKPKVSMDDLFSASRVNFLMEYGIVVTFSWLMSHKKCTEIEARDIVSRILKDALKDGESCVKHVADITLSFSPYPITYDNKSLRDLLCKSELGNVVFSENAQERF